MNHPHTPMSDAEVYDRMLRTGSISPTCPTCIAYFGAPDSPDRNGRQFAPRHNASTRCRSGRRPHCTCDTCF